MSEQSKYGAIETPATATAAATPKRRGLIIALCLCTGGALFAVAGPARAPTVDSYYHYQTVDISNYHTNTKLKRSLVLPPRRRRRRSMGRHRNRHQPEQHT